MHVTPTHGATRGIKQLVSSTGYPHTPPTKGTTHLPTPGPSTQEQTMDRPLATKGGRQFQLGTDRAGAGPTRLGVPAPLARTRTANPGPATAGCHRGNTPRKGHGRDGRTGIHGPAPGLWGPVPTWCAGHHSAPPRLRSTPRRRGRVPPPRCPRRSKSSRPRCRVRRLWQAPRRTGLEWSPRWARSLRTPASPVGRDPPTERPSGTRWHRGLYPPRTAWSSPRGAPGISVVRSQRPR